MAVSLAATLLVLAVSIFVLERRYSSGPSDPLSIASTGLCVNINCEFTLLSEPRLLWKSISETKVRRAVVNVLSAAFLHRDDMR